MLTSVYLSSIRPMFDLPDIFAENPNTNVVISPSLRREIERAKPGWENEAPSNIPARELYKLENAVMVALDELPHPYHNGNHTRDMLGRASKYTAHLAVKSGEQVVVRLAGLFHDHLHCGTGYRQMLHAADPRSNEEIAVLAFDHSTSRILTLRERLVGQGLILSTSFMQKEPVRASRLDIARPYGPHTPLEQLFQFADVMPMDDQPTRFLSGGIAVAAEMAGKGNPLPPIEKFFASQKWFTGYAAGRFAEVKAYLRDEDRSRIEARLECAQQELEHLMQGSRSTWEQLAEGLYKHACHCAFRL